MMSTDFMVLKNKQADEYFDYMIKHNVWIAKNNFEMAWGYTPRFKRIAEISKVKRDKLSLRFYFPEDDVVKKEPIKEIVEFLKDQVEKCTDITLEKIGSDLMDKEKVARMIMLVSKEMKTRPSILYLVSQQPEILK
jgi:Glu-tRNA(Gln) amidotransferase subunit E-like FAD-binding protein